MSDKQKITIKATIAAPISKVWEYWTKPEHVTKWNFASDDWHSPRGENDLRPGGAFSYRMESKDGQHGFDFGGVYDTVELQKRIVFTMGDTRKVEIFFDEKDGKVIVTETFEAESQNSLEMQRNGWQSILDNFKKYVENN